MSREGGDVIPSLHCGDEVPIIDVTFVDDEAIIFMATFPATLDKHLRFAIAKIVEVFSSFGLKINWSKGKTEMMI